MGAYPAAATNIAVGYSIFGHRDATPHEIMRAARKGLDIA
jgi:hypothetical protein